MNPQEIGKRLAAPFDARDVRLKPKVVSHNRALAISYVDARAVEDRLDEVLGVENWQDEYQVMGDGSVVCQLRVKIGEDWITKTDVGSPSEQPDGGDRLKAAFSDALKRAAVKFGVGRYLYRLPAVWMDYDPIKKLIVSKAPPPATAGKAGKTEKAKTATMPANGKELFRRLDEYDAQLAAAKRCARRALINYVREAGAKAGYAAPLTEWSGPAIPFAVDAVREFKKSIAA